MQIKIKNKNINTKVSYLGDKSLLNRLTIGFTGSRKADSDALDIINKVVKNAVDNNYVVISGLALGVDTMAHQACLDYGGKTMAVLPSGLNNIYPHRNKKLAKNIINHGGLMITEYSDDFRACRDSFINRNRLISGLSLKLFVGQCDIHSGTMHTVRFAKKQGVPMFTVNNGSGNDYIIKKGWAKAIDKDSLSSIF